MADIFISYKREDKHLAEDTIHALKQAGFSVWYDDRIDPHTSWDETIEREIAAAKAVVVLWTPRSVASQWVRTEADYAAQHGKIVPVMLEQSAVPLAYRRTQFADLTQWDGNADDRNFEKLTGWVRGLVDGSGSGPDSIGASTFGAEPARKKKGSPLPVLAALAVLLIAGAGGLYAGGIIGPDMFDQPTPQGETTVTSEPEGPTAEEIAAQREADRQAAAQAERDRIAQEEAARIAAIPSCFRVRLVADDEDSRGANWDFPAPSPDPHVTSSSHRSLRFGCDNTYSCNSGRIDNPSKLEQVALLIQDEDIDQDDLMGAGNCGIPSSRCRVGRVTVDVDRC
ncbi:MAG: TIR domain-containing protein [Pseudomonadota bacterium]